MFTVFMAALAAGVTAVLGIMPEGVMHEYVRYGLTFLGVFSGVIVARSEKVPAQKRDTVV
jgi:hypothetical protein